MKQKTLFTMLTIAEFENQQLANSLSKKLNQLGVQSYVATRLKSERKRKFRLTIDERDREQTLKILFS